MPILSEDREPILYHNKLDNLLRGNSDEDLHTISRICMEAANETGSRDNGPKNAKRPEKSDTLRDLLACRRIEKDPVRRRLLSKQIYKQISQHKIFTENQM